MQLKSRQSQFEAVPKIALPQLAEPQILRPERYHVSLGERAKCLEGEAVSLRTLLIKTHQDFNELHTFAVGFFEPGHIATKAYHQHEKTTKDLGDKSLGVGWWKSLFQCTYDLWRT